MAGRRTEIPVTIFFNDQFSALLRCRPNWTLMDVRKAWHNELGASPSVAFFLTNDRFVSDKMTVAEAQTAVNTRGLELTARLNTAYWIELLGFEASRTLFEVAPCLSPRAVRRQIVASLGVILEEFRLTYAGTVLDQEKSFEELAVPDGHLLTVDMQVQVKLRSGNDEEEPLLLDCYSSETIGNLREQHQLDEEQAIVTTAPNRRVLSDSLQLCNVVGDKSELDLPIDLVIEKSVVVVIEKVMVPFEPFALSHLRQELSISPSATPLDLFNEVSQRFEINCEFRLTVNGKPLDNCVPILEQGVESGTVVQIDICPPCMVKDLWEDYERSSCNDMVFLYSSESAHALKMPDSLDEHRLMVDGFVLPNLTSSLMDCVSGFAGRCQSLLRVDHDVRRTVPFLSSGKIERRSGWAAERVVDVAPTESFLDPQTLMCHASLAAHEESLGDLKLNEESLVTVDPVKVAVEFKKRLRICRVPGGSAFADIRALMEQALDRQNLRFRSNECALDEGAINRKFELELYLLESASRYRTQLQVTITTRQGIESYHSWFEAAAVSFSDVIISVGRQAKIPPRHLFGLDLYCCGCGRRVSKEDESHQKIPAACCQVRSLRLTDRKGVDIGTQTAIPRERSVATEMFSVESRDAAVNTESEQTRIVVDTSTEIEHSSFSTQDTLPRILRITAVDPWNKLEETTVTLDAKVACEAIPAAAAQRLKYVSIHDNNFMYWQQRIYERDGQKRSAVLCFDFKTRKELYIDADDGSVPDEDSFVSIARQFLLPSSRLPASPRLTPYILLLSDTDVCVVDEKGEPKSAPKDALTDLAHVAVVSGVINSGRVLFELATGRLTDNTKIKFGGLIQAFFKEERKSRVVILLRHLDPIPRAQLPKKSDDVLVLRREKVELTVVNNCVQNSVAPGPEQIVWFAPICSDTFQEHFTKSAKKL